MSGFRPFIALLLLAVLTAGGTVAPVVHRVAHAEETAETRERHATAEHHHHAGASTHGTEVVPPCPEPLADHLLCVLCAAASGAVAMAQRGGAKPEPSGTLHTRETFALLPGALMTQGARGPPVQA